MFIISSFRFGDKYLQPKLITKLYTKKYLRTKEYLMPTNPDIQATKPVAQKEKLNDIGFRVILIPFFGIAIPIITQMIPQQAFTTWQFKLSYLYTIMIAFVIWEGNRFLLFSLRSYFDWLNKPVKKIIALLLSVSFYTIPVSALLLVGWYYFFNNGQVHWNKVFEATLIIMICVIFITHVYETVFLVKQTETDKVKKEQLERSKAEAELQALKNQIDPHFIFNSLNTLSHLIEEKPQKARQFNDSLADVYRYILHNKERTLVLLREEMDFVNDYFLLLTIRFENAVQLKIDISDEINNTSLIPPISLQLLLENAIKHNEFSDETPLVISIEAKDGQLVITNDIHKKELRKESSRIGLPNLNERYRLTANNSIAINDTGKQFIVSLPILTIA
ncbi:MAG: histidine kinase [Bacteroidota bacterium]